MGCYASVSDRPGVAVKATTSSTGTNQKEVANGRRGGILEPSTSQTDGGTQTQDNDKASAAVAEAVGGANVMADASDLPDVPPGMVACPFCTFLNAANASACDVCGSPF